MPLLETKQKPTSNALPEQRQLITHSRQDAFKTCRKKHWFSYEQGIRTTEDATALRMGSIGHAALECFANTHSLDSACQVVYEFYSHPPELPATLEWKYEEQTILRLLCGYVWRWGDSPKYIHAEFGFKIALTNPETKSASKIFDLGGKIDGIVTLEDGRLAVIEHKWISEELDSDSRLWRRLQIDHQISMYVIAARRMGFDVQTVLYDAIRKPTIRPTNVPILDSDGLKIVLDANGNRVANKNNTWKQTGSTEDGFVVQTRPMTPEEWGDKLTADITERPHFYFARNEIARLDQDLEVYQSECWDIQKTIRDAQLNDRHYRTCNRDTCAWCSFFDLCTVNWQPDQPLLDKFIKVENIHPELGDINVIGTPIEATASASGKCETYNRASQNAGTGGLFNLERDYV